jgi:uncharacterized protein YjcR
MVDEKNIDEEWRDIPGFEGRYIISNYGKIKSVISSKFLKPGIDKYGYSKVTLFDGYHKPRYLTIHRLVGLTFIPNPENLPQINHIDNNKQNNFVNNLEWCTIQYNNKYRHIIDPDLFKRSGENFATKLNKEKVLEIYNLVNEKKVKQSDIANRYGISVRTIRAILDKDMWENVTRDLPDIVVHKLSDDTVIEIYELAWNKTLQQKDIAERYNIDPNTVLQIKNGKTHSNITKHKYNPDSKYYPKLTDKDVLEIYNSTLNAKEISNLYNIAVCTVHHIKNGSVWGHVTKHEYKPKERYSTKLTEKEVLEIYNLAIDSIMKPTEISEKYSISMNVVYQIKNGHSWNHVTHHKN